MSLISRAPLNTVSGSGACVLGEIITALVRPAKKTSLTTVADFKEAHRGHSGTTSGFKQPTSASVITGRCTTTPGREQTPSLDLFSFFLMFLLCDFDPVHVRMILQHSHDLQLALTYNSAGNHMSPPIIKMTQHEKPWQA